MQRPSRRTINERAAGGDDAFRGRSNIGDGNREVIETGVPLTALDRLPAGEELDPPSTGEFDEGRVGDERRGVPAVDTLGLESLGIEADAPVEVDAVDGNVM